MIDDGDDDHTHDNKDGMVNYLRYHAMTTTTRIDSGDDDHTNGDKDGMANY